MGNTTTKNSRRHSISTGSTVKRVHWGSSAGLPAPPGKPILIPSLTEDSQPIIVGIRWERSPNNGGSAIIGYLVEHRRVGSPHWIRSSPGLCSFPELTLSGLEPGWRYQFRVRAQNGVGLSQTSELSDPLTVTLQRAAASAPCFLLELNDTIALENEQVEFIVHFTGTPIPKISWFKDGFEIFSSRRTKIITENGRSSLLIHQTALNDEGEIKCTATNKAGYVSTRGKLLLQALPRIRLPRQYEDGLLFEKGETIRLKVSVAGRPSPNVTWYHDGEIVIFDDRHVIESIDTGEYSITILTAMRNDRGEYMIKAVNKLGEDNTSFLVTVTDRPAAPGKVTIIMTLGRSVTLSWNEPNDDGGCKIGTYIIEYYRIGWDVWLKAGTSRQATTTLGDLIGDSEYKFRCKAENPYGVSDPSDESDVVFISNTGTGSSRSEQALDRFKNSQKQVENDRGRKLEKHDQASGKATKRTRSLTRDGIAHEHIREFYSDVQAIPSRSVSAQRLIPITQPTKPARSDSRVTFATTVCLHGEQPLNDIEIPLAKPRVKHDKSFNNNNNNNNNNFNGNYNSNNSNNNNNSNKKDVNSNDEQTNNSIDSKVLNSNDTNSPFSENHSNLGEKSMSPLPKIRVDQSGLMEKRDESYRQKDDEDMHEEEYESEKMNEEFMLVLYPDDNEEDSDKKYPPDDLRPPLTSLSLPELFSTNYDVIEVLRDAFSSTELLHELAVERFYKAVAMEEENESTNKGTEFEKIKDGLDFFSYKLRSIHSQKANTVGRTPDHSGIRRKWNRRSSEGYTESLNPHRLSNPLSSQSPQLVLSDSNLRDIEIEEEFRNKILRSDSTNSTSLHRWDDKSMPLVPEDSKLSEPQQVPPSELFHHYETFDESFRTDRNDIYLPEDNEDKDSVTSEDLNLFKSRVLGQSDIVDNRNMHTPQGGSMSHESVINTGLKTNTIQPKSILKKRTEEISFPLNSFGRPIPPEKVIVDESKLIKEIEFPNDSVVNRIQFGSSNVIEKENSSTDLSNIMRMSIMSDIESDNTNLMNAAEVAKNRRKSNGKYSLERKQSTDNEEDIEAQRAVINHYTEIMREYSMSPPMSSSRFTSRIDSVETNPNEMLSTQKSNTTIEREATKYREESNSKISSSFKSRDVSVERKPRISKSSRIDPERNHREKSTSRSSSKTRKKREPSIGRIIGKNNSSHDSGKLQTTDSRNTLSSSEASKLQSSHIIDEQVPRINKPGINNDAKTNKFEEILIIQTRIKVQSTMSYIIDLTLFLAAVYIYFFKKEIFAIPFIALILYRRIQKHMADWMPHQ